jgi:peptidyl-prolyl cis-trans isomerase C
MKALCLFVFSAALWGQAAPPAVAPPAPAMPDLPDDAVIATFEDGGKFTMGDFKAFYAVMPAPNQQMAMRDRAEFIHQWAVLRKITKMGDEKKLGTQSPYKEAIEHARMQVMVQAMINEQLNSVVVEPGEIVKYYEANKKKYGQVKVKAIYVAYSEDASTSSAGKGKKPLTEAEAKAKATRLAAQIKDGADFVKLVKENSDDETSRDKNGDFATLHFGDNIPDAFRTAIFNLKQGEVSDPLKQPNGYYLLRAEEVTYRALPEVRDDIYNELKNQRYADWFAKLNRETVVQINPAFAPKTGK